MTQKSKIVFVISLIIVIILGLYTYRLISGLTYTTDNIQHFGENIKSLDLLFILINDAESSRRGYVLTGNNGFLDNYTQSIQELENIINQLKPIISRHSNQQKQFDSMELLIKEKINSMNQSIESYRKNRSNRTLQTRITEQGKKQMDAIRILHSELISEENRLFQNQMDLSKKQKNRIYITLFLSYLVIILLLLWVLNQVKEYTDIRGKPDKELSENVEIYKDISKVSGEIIQTFNPEGKITYTNRCFRDSLDYSDVEIKEMFLIDLIHPEHRDAFKETIHNLTSGEPINQLETVFISKNRRAIHVEGKVGCKFLDNKPESYYGIFRDMTEQLKTTEERDRFFDSSPEMLAIAGFDGYFKRLNPAWVKVIGYTFEEMLVKPYMEWVHPDDKDIAANELEKLTREKIAVSFENRYLCKDGRYHWLLWNITPDKNNQLLYIVVRDITDKKKEQLEHKQLTTIVNTVENAIINTALDGTITTWNQGAQKIFGYMANEIIDLPVHTLVPKEYQKEFIENLEQLKKGEKIQGQETIGLTKDHRNINISYSIIPLYDLSGAMNGASILSQDITERKLIEHKLEENQKISLEMSTFDELTGLLNRKELFRQLNEELTRAKRYKRPLTLLMMDLDHFKKINDIHGHLAGDEVLKAVGQLICQNKRIIDKAGRYGGEEFLTILPETNAKTAFETAERFRKYIEKLSITISQENQTNIQTTISIGLASYPVDADTEDALISKADRALYEAKRLGRNKTVVYQNMKSTDSLFE